MPTPSNDNDKNSNASKRPRLQSRPPQQPKLSSSNLRTFTDLLGGGVSRADSALGQSAPADAWSSIVDTVDNLLPAQPKLSSAHPSAHGPASLHQNPSLLPSDYSLRELSNLPLDLSLKTRVRISSVASLSWARIRSQHDSFCALQDVLSDNNPLIELPNAQPRAHNNEDSTAPAASHAHPSTRPHPTLSLLKDAHSLFNRRLIHFRFPTCPSSPSLSSNWHNIFSNKDKQTLRDIPNFNQLSGEAFHRLSMWQDAMQSIYYGYRYGHVPNFYVLLPRSTIFFNRAPDNKHNPVALLAPASSGLRSLLSDYIVPFTICHAETDSTDKVSVIVKGEFDVHTLYNFIICAAHKLSGATDVPMIVCDQPFIGGTPLTADIESFGEAKFRPDPSDSSKTSRFTIHINGVLTPKQVQGICHALAHTQQSNFTAALDTLSQSAGLNNFSTEYVSTQLAVLKGRNVLTQVTAFPHLNGLYAIVSKGKG